MPKLTRFFVFSSLAIGMTITTPLISIGGDTGHDWYCSDPEAHATYEKHLKSHLDRTAEPITETLDRIYTDPTLNKTEKKAKTLEVLNKYLSKMKAGIGD